MTAEGVGSGGDARAVGDVASGSSDRILRRKYRRGEAVDVKRVGDKKLRGRLRQEEQIAAEAAKTAAGVEKWLNIEEVGGLEPETPLEATWRLKQEDIAHHVEVGAAAKRFDLNLADLGPYSANYSRDGRWLLLGGRRGHLAMLDWSRRKLICEVQVKETVRDVCFLHNSVFFAAAQRKHVYIYDKRGIEIHCLRDHFEANQLQFLPYHFLLATVGSHGVLRYQDTSTGEMIAQHKTKLGPCAAMTQNPYNGVLLLGHGNGTVTMWSPNMTTSLVKVLSHRGPVRAVAVDPSGQYFVTTGTDKQVKVWDARTFKTLHQYYSSAPANDLKISQKGLMAVSWGSRVQVWKDCLSTKASAPYLNHENSLGKVTGVEFCPYEDVLGIGHSNGFSSILVPGAGEPNYDSFVANPFQTRKERREKEVHSLLEKLQPDTIVLDPTSIGQLRQEPADIVAERRVKQREAAQAQKDKQRRKNEAKMKMKGKNKPTKRHRKKQLNIIRDRKQDVASAVASKRDFVQQKLDEDNVPSALHRFFKK